MIESVSPRPRSDQTTLSTNRLKELFYGLISTQAHSFHFIGIEFTGMPDHYRLQQASRNTVLFEVRTVLQATGMTNAVLNSADQPASSKAFDYVI